MKRQVEVKVWQDEWVCDVCNKTREGEEIIQYRVDDFVLDAHRTCARKWARAHYLREEPAQNFILTDANAVFAPSMLYRTTNIKP